MSKSIKFKNNTYLDSKSVIHNRETLSSILDSNLISSSINVSSATKGQNNYINSISLGKGTWIIIGEWRYEGFELSSWTNLIGVTFSGASSKYDNSGYVNDQIVGILVNTSTSNKTINLNLWPRDKNVEVISSICAVRIK